MPVAGPVAHGHTLLLGVGVSVGRQRPFARRGRHGRGAAATAGRGASLEGSAALAEELRRDTLGAAGRHCARWQAGAHLGGRCMLCPLGWGASTICVPLKNKWRKELQRTNRIENKKTTEMKRKFDFKVFWVKFCSQERKMFYYLHFPRIFWLSAGTRI